MLDPNNDAVCATALSDIYHGPWLRRVDDGVEAQWVTRARVSAAGELEVFVPGEGWTSYAGFAAARITDTDALAGVPIP